MPWPIDLYQGPLSFSMSMPDAFQRLISAICVPDRSPREMNGAPSCHDLLERCADVLHALDAGRVALGADQHKVVVHHRVTLHAFAFGEEFLLRRFRVHKHDVRISAPAGIERLPGSLRYDFHLDAGLLREQRQDVTE